MDNKTKEKEIRIYMRDWETQKLTYIQGRHGMRVSPDIKSFSVA